MKAANRVIFNSSILYTRLIIGMIIGLFTTRIVLDALGETNFGVYMLVAGVIGMLDVLNSNMSNTSMRYMSYSLGSNDKETIFKTFNSTLFLHFAIGIIVVFIMEILGIIMFEYLLNVPEEKIFDAKIIFHFMVLTTFITVISVPYDAVMNAHENILALSVVDIIGSILRLGGAIYLMYSNANLLILYGFLMLVIQIILRVIKQWYSKIKYSECKIRFRQYIDKKLIKSILSFTVWNLFGSLAALSVTQVKGIVLNMFFGVSINAADGISKTASSKVNMVSVSMTRAINPQLVKSEGGGDRQKMIRLTEVSTKFSIFLFSLLAVPVFFEMPYLLNLWLKNVPEYSIIFCRLILLAMFLEKFTFEITTALRAVGKIRNFQVIESVVWILNIPIYYIVLKMGYPPYSVFIVSIVLSLFGACVRLYFGKLIAKINLVQFFKNGIFPVLIPVLFAILFSGISFIFMQEGFLRLLVTTLSSFIAMIIIFCVFGLKNNEAKTLKNLATSILERFIIRRK